MRKVSLMVAVVLLAALPIAGGVADGKSAPRRYLVLYADGVSNASARAALADLDATVLAENTAIGLVTVRTSDPNFVANAMATGKVKGVARDRWIGRAPSVPSSFASSARKLRSDRFKAYRQSASPARRAAPQEVPEADPLFKLQWGMRMMNAGPAASYETDMGDERVLVAVMDDGIDERHRDLRGQVDMALSRSFTTDIPAIDGPCKDEPDKSCQDAPEDDDGFHGTYVASIIAAAANDFGMSGVAPDVTLVNLVALQDSGYAFLQPVVDALTYAGDNGIDVANMSFFIDPWLFNCPNNSADSPEEQLEQQTIIAATQEAIDYARERGVTTISALGNEFYDYNHKTVDTISPDYPPGSERDRTIDETCLNMPAEADGVISVTAVGPSGRKSFYSNYGLGAADVAAPGGDGFDPALPYPQNELLGAFPTPAAREFGFLNAKGKPNVPFIKRHCRGDKCAYYGLLDGTSFAAPNAVAVAALIVGKHGEPDGTGLTMDPEAVEAALLASSIHHDCPANGVQEYPDVGDQLLQFGISEDDLDAPCEEAPGNATANGLYGAGIVNAFNALAD